MNKPEQRFAVAGAAMKSFEVSINPKELEQDIEQLKMLPGLPLDHVSLAESMWTDEYGDMDDPTLSGFAIGSRDGSHFVSC